MEKNGAHILVETLLEEGVEVLFGYPGGAVIPIFDALYEGPIKVMLTRHEQGAAHAADGYARATGKVGVCLATSGPGALNLTTGIATANMDSIPMVAITGQVKTHLIGNDAFQEADVTGVTRPITKHNYLVKDVHDLGRIIREAFHIARTGRPGPVLIDIPVDVTTAKPSGPVDKTPRLPGYKPHIEGNPRQIKLAAQQINASQRPVLYVGGGVISSGASAELLQLAEKARIHVTTTLMGLGSFPSAHALNLGMLGMHGTPTANYAVTESDLIIAVGARFDDRITGRIDAFAPNAKVIHIDVDPSSISKNIPVHIPVVGDAKIILSKLIPHITPVDREAWAARIAEWKRRHPLNYKRDTGKIKPQFVLEQLCAAVPEDTIFATEVGQNQMWACQWLQFKRPRSWLSSGGLGTMGYGLPAAIGAKAGRPGAMVVDIAGDGSIQMNIQELATAKVYNLPVKVMILDNGYLGMVRQWQELFYNRRYSSTRLNGNPDFVKLAEAYGAKGMRVSDPGQVRPAIEEALKTDDTVMIDFLIDPEENVYPMVPAGEAINRMIGGMA
ncbi:MAG TPA: biosynthetic-type acetolactate synthase large subunit [Candidatus Brocadiia bacterium]|nr:biosynthetic-type acetolactate synthase large subunit [Candidatus Brocadiia bacterium]